MGTGATLPNNIPACRSEFDSRSRSMCMRKGCDKEKWWKKRLVKKRSTFFVAIQPPEWRPTATSTASAKRI